MAIVLLGIAVAGALAEVSMVAAILPILHVLAQPEIISTNPHIGAFRDLLGLTSDYQVIIALGSLSIATIGLANAAMVLRTYAIARFAQRRVHSISLALTRAYLARSFEDMVGRPTGDLAKRILAESGQIASSFLTPIANIVAASVSLAAILGLLLFVSPWVTLGGLVVLTALYAGLSLWVAPRLKAIGARRVAANRARFEAINDVFGGLKDVKITGSEDMFLTRFDAASRAMVSAQILSAVLSEAPRFVIQALFFSAVVLSCLLLVDPAAVAGTRDQLAALAPTLGAFALAGQRMIPEAQRLYAATSQIALGAAALSEVFSDISTPEATRRETAPVAPMARALAIDAVSYTYPGASAPALKDVTLTIPVGARIGIVGASGSGKSTLADIIMGLLPPRRGEVRVDDSPLDSDARRRGWRQRIAYVPQDIHLADASIAENVAFGTPAGEIDHDRVAACARMARIGDLLAACAPETGRRLQISGGQRQRLGIARALYRGADILVLDEATSALDTVTEQAVIDAIEALPETMTVIMIAHRLSSLRGCGRLLVVDDGRIVQDGSWKNLSGESGRFREFLDASGMGRATDRPG